MVVRTHVQEICGSLTQELLRHCEKPITNARKIFVLKSGYAILVVSHQGFTLMCCVDDEEEKFYYQ